ncbi:sensor histidine kinase [Saccharothrix lopnurensis]|uniref:Sensor-like histidine kinase SenX3 n=1 Tax=Saccharothrix lopnurensis TaxID=1670621 RepID=A0ABW1P316_9PSEU
MTATGYFILSIGALLIGGVAFLVGRATARPRDSRPRGLTVADLMAMVVRSSHDGIAVLNAFGDVVLHNARAEELGVVRGSRVDDRARRAAELARRDGGVVSVDLSSLEVIKGRQPTAVHASVKVLTESFVVVEASDESEAVRLEATRRDFVANVSHELKTPVGALALLAEAVLDASDDQEQVRRFSAKIMQEATRLGTLVTELIALSRLQGAEKLPELSPVEVDVVVSEAMGRTRLAAERAEIAVTTDEPGGLAVEGDRTLLVTALSNLLDNAIAYSSPGSPVSVSRKLVDGYVEIAVTDRGIGIAEDQQTRVFERFYRVDKARSRVTGGTGLGLAIVKHVANNHGGEVRLWSLPGTGSTFTLRLPAHPDRETSTTDPTRGAPAGVAPTGQELTTVPTGAAGNHGGEL